MTSLLFLLAIAASIGDVVTTKRFLALGITEANPIARWLFDRVGVAAGGALLKLLWVVPVVVADRLYPGHIAVKATLAFLVLLNGYAVLHNLENIRRRKLALRLHNR